VEFDSFADLVVFGLAPAALYYFLMEEMAYTSSWFNFGFASIYVVCTATRLARFNVTTEVTPENLFIGLPTTLSGAILSTGYLSVVAYLGRPLTGEDSMYATATLVCFAFLMISPFYLPKLQKYENRPFINFFQFANVFICYILTPMREYPQYLCACASLYLIIGFGSQLIKKINPPKEVLQA
jgi:CDP-diacylglycerol--serine O-phosphatidyltransferase